MLNKKEMQILIKENQEYLDALETYDLTGKLVLPEEKKERVNFTISHTLMEQFRTFCKQKGLRMSNKVESMIRKSLT